MVSKFGAISFQEYGSKGITCTLYYNDLVYELSNDMNVFLVLNSHSHVMYISSILLAKYSEVKVSLKPRKTTAYTKLSMTKVWRLIQCI